MIKIQSVPVHDVDEVRMAIEKQEVSFVSKRLFMLACMLSHSGQLTKKKRKNQFTKDGFKSKFIFEKKIICQLKTIETQKNFFF